MTLDVNSYFDDKVKFIAFESGSGPCTAGVMAPGDYTFGTSQKELMKILEGELVDHAVNSVTIASRALPTPGFARQALSI